MGLAQRKGSEGSLTEYERLTMFAGIDDPFIGQPLPDDIEGRPEPLTSGVTSTRVDLIQFLRGIGPETSPPPGPKRKPRGVVPEERKPLRGPWYDSFLGGGLA